MQQPIELTAWQLSVAVSLILISAAISAALRLGLGQRLLLAAVRTTAQLLLIGYVLKWLFEPGRAWYFVLAMMSAMTLIAGISAVRRNDLRYDGIWARQHHLDVGHELADDGHRPVRHRAGARGGATPVVVQSAIRHTAVGHDPGQHHQRRFAQPRPRLTHELASKRDQVETLLALGATRWESGRWAVQQAVRVGMVPTINTMMVAGVVSLPGMMTGQMIAGQDPGQAARYQIMIMFLMAAGTSLGTFSVVLLGYRRLFTADHQFQPGRLRKVH